MPFEIIREVNGDVVFVCVSCGFKLTARKFPNGVLTFRSSADLETLFGHSDFCEFKKKISSLSGLECCTD